MPTTSTVGLAAIALAHQRWPVLACHNCDRNGRCTCTTSDCPSAAKHPRTPHGLHDATTDPTQVRAWWQRWPQANIGIRTGAQPDGAGLVVVDIDPAHGGSTSLTTLTDDHGPLPATLTVNTGGSGQHLYFTHPGVNVPNSTGRLAPGIDIRGDGGYIIAPPSRHATGSRYQWANHHPIAPTPNWLLHLITRPAEVTAERPTPPAEAPTDRWAAAALTHETGNVRHAPQGCRNHTLNRAAFSLGQLVASGHLHPDQVTDTLTAAAHAAGLTPSETRATIASGLRAGTSHPRQRLSG